MAKIILKPLTKIENFLLEKIKENLSLIFNLEVEIKNQILNLDFAFNSERKQYSGSEILSYLKSEKINNDKWLAIVDVDLYSPGLNFIFGLADPISNLAVISILRLNEEYYGLPKNEKLFLERSIKEAVHELGHLFGLSHCQNSKCVMHFSNSLLDTDRKSSSFCPSCSQSIK